MLNFDEERFRKIQGGAVALAEPIRETVGELLDGGAENVYFLGAGGAGVLMLPAAQLLQRRSAFPMQLVHAAEIVLTDSAALGANSIVVIPSLSGTTKESVAVMEFAQAKGAKVIALTGHEDTPVAQGADVNFTNFAADDTSSESFYLQSLLIALAILDARGELDGDGDGGGYDAIVQELALLPDALVEVKRGFEDRAASLAEAYKDEPYHIIVGGGSAWAEAWYYGTCILEEMQWIRTRPVHASDFFHGTLELVEQGVSVLLLKSEDEARALADRVESFVPTVTDKLEVVDPASFELPGVSKGVRALITPVLLAAVLERLSAHLEVLRDHPLTTRRYYRRVEY
ncbi:MAG TPA: SIS domain-containing protein [Baekduia sp.]|uniref:SIS domain-containing protein n=1 Tax=Baekduia sp. TaxID=2600305 RepID=UPI002D76916E|nr:SIS domain-containing protein [Baekduia sp.]HET6507786.1 SIS domain-containing protein [Baekduia sp.]